MRVALKFAYNGRKYHGFARQPNLLTIEDEIINSLKKNGFIDDIKKSKFQYASRTDKGVSAIGNVIAFDTDFLKENILQKLSKDFTDILFYGIINVSSQFNPRYANLRTYRYYLSRFNMDYRRTKSISKIFIGEHDFSNFARVESFKNPIKKIENINISKKRNLLFIDFYAQTFLWHQIRRIVSSIIKFEKGKIEKNQIEMALENPNKKFDFGLAPAEPLILLNISYDFIFEYNEKLYNKLRFFKKKLMNDLDVSSIKPPVG